MIRNKKIASLALAGLLLTSILGVSFVAPRSAHAFGLPVPTGEDFVPLSEDWWREYVLKPGAHILLRVALQAVSQQIVGWINGDASNTGFVGNFEKGLRNELDVRAGQFLNELAGVNLCGNFKLSLILSLQTPSGGLQRKLGCTLTGIANNAQSFFQDFQNGSWNNFLEIGIRPQNNPFGAYAIAYDAKLQAETSRARALVQEKAQGSVFKGFQVDEQKCELVTNHTGENPGGEFAGETADTGQPDTKQVCYTEKKVLTPGETVSHALNKSIDIGIDFGVNAKDFDEAIASIVNALVNKLAQAGKGFLNPREGGGSDFTDTFPTEVAQSKPQLISTIDNGLAKTSAIITSIDQDISTISRQLETEHQNLITRRKTDPGARPSASAITLQNNLTTLIDQRQRVLVAEADLLRAKSAATTGVTNQDIAYTTSLVAPSIQAINAAVTAAHAHVTATPLTGNTRIDALALFADTLDNLKQAETTLTELNGQISPTITANLDSIATLQAQEASLPAGPATADKRTAIDNAIAVTQGNISGLNAQKKPIEDALKAIRKNITDLQTWHDTITRSFNDADIQQRVFTGLDTLAAANATQQKITEIINSVITYLDPSGTVRPATLIPSNGGAANPITPDPVQIDPAPVPDTSGSGDGG